MELSISRSELKTAVTGLSRIIPNRVTLPILGGVRFTADQNGTLTATATDIDQTVSYRFINTTSVDVGTFILPLTALKELTKGADREHIELKNLPDQQIAVTNHVGGHAIRLTLNTLPTEDWPETDKPLTTKPADGFLETYRRLLPFASTDETRYAINTIYVDVDGKGDHPVCMVAVDGRRLSVWNSMAFDLEHSVPVPTSRFLSWNGLTGKVQIGLREEITPKRGKDPESRKAWFGVTVGPWEYVTRVPDVNFPNWRQVVPDYQNDPNTQCCCFTDADAEALRKILPTFPGHDGYNSAITLVGRDGRLTICGRGKDDTVDTAFQLEGGSSYQGKGGHIGLNRFYLLDALASGFRTFSYVDATTPLKSVDGRGGTHVVMPVRVDHESAAPTPPAVSENVPVTTTETKKENEMPEKTDLSALDRLQAAYEVTRQKVREANTTVAEIAGLIREVAKDDKQRRIEVESVRAGLAKLQAIKV